MPTTENKIQSSLRPIILTELFVPLILLVFGIFQGVLQTLYRAGILRASSFGGIGYYQGLTAHGVINALVLTTFFAVAFGNAVMSQFLGIPISVRAARASLLVMLAGALTAATEIFLGNASVLYTFYPPLRANPLFYLGLALFIVGSWIAFYSWIPCYLRWRKENPGRKTPLAVVGILATFIVWQIATLPVAYEVLVLLLPWSMGLVPGVNVVLARTLFWFFGHPLVYFWLLPAYVMYYVMLPRLAGGKLFSDFAGRFSFLMFVVFSSPVGMHHQFADPGIGSHWKAFHAVMTSLVAAPSMITAFTLAASLEIAGKMHGGRGLFQWWTKLPYFEPENWLFPYFFCGLVIFIFGGITGVVNASYGMNMVVHNTAWLPAHFHMTVAGPVFLGILGMSLYLCAGLLGREVAFRRGAMLVPWLWTLGIMTFSGGLFIGGLRGEPRRTNLGLTYLNPHSPSYRPDWFFDTHMTAIGGCIMAAAVALFFAVLIATLRRPFRAEILESFELPSSEPFHDENIPAVQNLRPWIIAAVCAVVLAYAIPLRQISEGNYKGAPGYDPGSPVSISQGAAK